MPEKPRVLAHDEVLPMTDGNVLMTVFLHQEGAPPDQWQALPISLKPEQAQKLAERLLLNRQTALEIAEQLSSQDRPH